MKKILVIAGAATLGGLIAVGFTRFLDKRDATAGLTNNRNDVILGRPLSNEVLPEIPDFRLASKRILESVVSINTAGTVQNFFGETSTQKLAEGSGVVIDKNGYVVTNNHVVTNEQGNPAEVIQVHTIDGKVYPATLVGRDPRSDLAVLKLDATDLVPVELADNTKLEIGQWVIAAGNPLGYENTVSVGVVSSIGRAVDLSQNRRGSYLVNAIQTDAAINPGNSGGALADSQGRLIGINSAIASVGGGSNGIGFAIPVERVKRVTTDIIKLGHARYGQLGLDPYLQPGLLANDNVRNEMKDRTGAEPPSSGLIVSVVRPESPAAQLGIEQLSILLSVDGTKLVNPIDLQKILADKLPGDKVRVKFWKKGVIKEAEVTLKDLTNN